MLEIWSPVNHSCYIFFKFYLWLHKNWAVLKPPYSRIRQACERDRTIIWFQFNFHDHPSFRASLIPNSEMSGSDLVFHLPTRTSIYYLIFIMSKHVLSYHQLKILDLIKSTPTCRLIRIKTWPIISSRLKLDLKSVSTCKLKEWLS